MGLVLLMSVISKNTLTLARRVSSAAYLHLILQVDLKDGASVSPDYSFTHFKQQFSYKICVCVYGHTHYAFFTAI